MADPVGKRVYDLFIGVYFVEHFFVIRVDKAHGLREIARSQFQHLFHRVIAGAEGERGGIKKFRIQRFEQFIVHHWFFRLVPDDLPAHFFINGNYGKKQERAAQIEYGVGVRNTAGVDRNIPDRIQPSGSPGDNYRCEHEHRFAEIKKNVHDTDASCLRFRADRADYRGRHAIAEVDAHYHGIYRTEGQPARDGKSLKDAYRGRGALKHERHRRSYSIPDKRTPRKGGEHPSEKRAPGKGTDSTGHIQKSAEQDTEAYQDIPRCPCLFVVAAHYKHYADDQRHGGKRRRFEDLKP